LAPGGGSKCACPNGVELLPGNKTCSNGNGRFVNCMKAFLKQPIKEKVATYYGLTADCCIWMESRKAEQKSVYSIVVCEELKIPDLRVIHVF